MAYKFYRSCPAFDHGPEGAYNGFDRFQRSKVGSAQWRAFKSGKVPPPSRCMTCGQEEGDLAAHLEDYDRPFDYLPLCYPCHATLHGRYKRPWMFQDYSERLGDGFQPVVFTSWDWHLYRRTYLQVEPWAWEGVVLDPPVSDLTLYRLLPEAYTDHVPEPFRLATAGPLPGQHVHGPLPLL